MMNCNRSSYENINYFYANYSQQGCEINNLIYAYPSKQLQLSNCQSRTHYGFNNPLESDNFLDIDSQFDYAVYSYITGTNPPSTPIPGNLKRFV